MFFKTPGHLCAVGIRRNGPDSLTIDMKILDVPQSGTTGNTVSYKARYGQVRRKYVVPRDPRSASQMAYLLFVKINCNLALVGQPVVLDPPDFPRFGRNPVGQLTITNTKGVIALKLSVTGKPAQPVVVLGTKQRSAGVSYVDHFTILGVLPDPVQGVSDITDLYVAKYGKPRAGSRVFIQTFQLSNGWDDLPQPTSAIVPAA